MHTTRPTLYIGNKNYSSWSMRPWLALMWGGIAFDEHVIPLSAEGFGLGEIQAVRRISPTGRVPALHVNVDGVVVYESLSICEWAAEQAPSLWPSASLTRARARSVASEMHAGWGAVRQALVMNLRRRLPSPPPINDDVKRELALLFTRWSELLQQSGGPFLFGERSIADAMFAPVATRLRTYAIETPDDARAYAATLFDDAAFRAWEQAAEAEPWTIASSEALYR